MNELISSAFPGAEAGPLIAMDLLLKATIVLLLGYVVHALLGAAARWLDRPFGIQRSSRSSFCPSPASRCRVFPLQSYPRACQCGTRRLTGEKFSRCRITLSPPTRGCILGRR